MNLNLCTEFKMNEAGLGDSGGGAPASPSEPAAVGDNGVTQEISADPSGSVLGGEGMTPSTTVVPDAPQPAPTQVNIPENWKDALSEEFRNDPTLKAIGDVQTLAKSYIHSQKMIGKDKVVLPDENASQEDWQAFFQRLGHPEQMEAYNFDVPENAELQDGFLTELKKVGFENNILPHQMQRLVEWYSDANNRAIEQAMESHQNESRQELEALQQKWGNAYQTKVQQAKSALRATGMDDVFSWLDETGLGDNPKLIEIMATLGGKMIEEKIIDAGNQDPNVKTPNELQGEISEVLSNPKHPYYLKEHPEHKDAVLRVQRMYKDLYPTSNG